MRRLMLFCLVDTFVQARFSEYFVFSRVSMLFGSGTVTFLPLLPSFFSDIFSPSAHIHPMRSLFFSCLFRFLASDAFLAHTSLQPILLTLISHTTIAYTSSFPYLTDGCAPTNLAVYGSAAYNVCGSSGIQPGQWINCPVVSGAKPFEFDAADCCSSCAGTLDCFQAYTGWSSSICRVDIRRFADGANQNLTADCPTDHTNVIFGNMHNETDGRSAGFISGHCAQSC